MRGQGHAAAYVRLSQASWLTCGTLSEQLDLALERWYRILSEALDYLPPWQAIAAPIRLNPA